ncbi:MAG: hypothetical protein Tsb0034_01940 [Ekhidna sp.]
MKQLASHILLITIVIQLFWSSGYLVDYYVNSDVYKENCENKSRPELNCDGKCILAQKLLKSANQDEKDSFWPPISFEYVFKLEPIQLETTVYEHKHRFNWEGMHTPPVGADIFKPPV